MVWYGHHGWIPRRGKASSQCSIVLLVVVDGNANTAAAAQLMIIITKYAKTNNSRIVTSYGKYSSEEESVTVTQRTMQSG